MNKFEFSGKVQKITPVGNNGNLIEVLVANTFKDKTTYAVVKLWKEQAESFQRDCPVGSEVLMIGGIGAREYQGKHYPECTAHEYFVKPGQKPKQQTIADANPDWGFNEEPNF